MIASYRESGIVLDIGTGDGRFVSASAKANPDKFFIGIDANARPLEKLSTKITRKPARGGLPNAMFVQAAVEDLPCEFEGIANEIHINFPWGTLLRAVAVGDGAILPSLHRIAVPGCLLKVVFGIDAERDHSEIVRLGLPDLTKDHLSSDLVYRYQTAGFQVLRAEIMDGMEIGSIDSSWARKLQQRSRRVFAYLLLQAR